MLDAKKVYIKLKKEIIGVASGLDHAIVDNTTCSITLYWKNGTNSTLNFPKPDDGKGIKKVEINSDNHLICTLDDDSTIDAGLLPSGGSEYTEKITTLKDIWSIQHNLDYPYWKLTINIIDSDGNTTNGDIDINSSTNNLLVIKFNEPISGEIYIKK